jgi:hypothetical protein
MKTTLRRLALAGAFTGMIGCAGAQVNVETGTKAVGTAQASSMEQGCKAKRSNQQACIIETIAKSCRTENAEDDAFYKCTESKLDVPDSMEQRQFNVEASKGDDVISMRFGSGTMFDIASVQLTSIDEGSVSFEARIERLHVADPKGKQTVQAQAFSVAYDGTVNGETGLLKQMEIWGISVEKAGEGKVKVKFSSIDPSAISPGNITPVKGVADSDAAAPEQQ